MGVAVLDLTLMGWGSVFNSSAAPYQVNTMISDVVGGGPDGNATKLLPEGGWTSTGLAKLFTGTTNQTQPYSPPGSVHDNAGPNSAGSTKTGAIVGGVIGGVAFLALIGLAGWAIKKRRFSCLGSTKGANGEARTDKHGLQPIPTGSSAKPVPLTNEPSVVASEIMGTPVLGELGGRGVTPELEAR